MWSQVYIYIDSQDNHIDCDRDSVDDYNDACSYSEDVVDDYIDVDFKDDDCKDDSHSLSSFLSIHPIILLILHNQI